MIDVSGDYLGFAAVETAGFKMIDVIRIDISLSVFTLKTSHTTP